MLQQTTVAAVIPFYERFLARWPTVEALAAAKLDDVLAAWAGLGYYSRARNLHMRPGSSPSASAGALSRRRKTSCCELPGIGPYTAAAIAAIAFGAPATPVDGNIERVIARLFAVKQPLPAAKEEIRRLAATLTPAKRGGDFAQALMDLGASLCTPKRPSCLMCPLQRDCSAHAEGIESTLPVEPREPERPLRVGLAFLALREDAHVLLRRRPEAGLLGGMLEVPSTDWAETLPPVNEALRHGAGAGGVVGRARHRHCTPSRTSGWRRWSIAPSCRPMPRSPSGPIRSAAGGSPAATSTAPRCPA